jgi:hypothetical protein
MDRIRRKWGLGIFVLGVAAPLAANLHAEEAATVSVTCTSAAGERQHCAADTSAGVVMSRSIGGGTCLLGNTWGYDDDGVWVRDGCSAEFIVAGSPNAGAATAPAEAATAEPKKADSANKTWGFFDPGKGFLVGRNEVGELSISAYALVRYLNQNDDDGVFTDHLGRVRPVDTRKDIYSHRVLVWLNGWVGNPKLRYTIAWWGLGATDQDALFGNLGYQFHKSFNLYAGIYGNPGSRSMQGSHPYWLGTDRVMADEFFRPFFSHGIFANGEIAPGLWYNVSIGNSSSTLGNTAPELDRELTYGGSVWWMPTTKEFGPRGAYGDWEYHDEVATRFGMSAVYSPEERFTDIGSESGNTTIKLADSVNIFETGALVPGVTVTDVNYRVLAVDAGMKYKGIFLQAEFFHRLLDSFKADGVLPTEEIEDYGFYVQAAFYPMPKLLEVYGATSQIYGDSSAGFDDSSEYILGMNYYPFDTRNHRLNLQYINVNKSPVSSAFGYYTGGQKGDTVSVAFSIFF